MTLQISSLHRLYLSILSTFSNFSREHLRHISSNKSQSSLSYTLQDIQNHYFLRKQTVKIFINNLESSYSLLNKILDKKRKRRIIFIAFKLIHHLVLLHSSWSQWLSAMCENWFCVSVYHDLLISVMCKQSLQRLGEDLNFFLS